MFRHKIIEILILILLSVSSCNQNESPPQENFLWQEIPARDSKKSPSYRIKIPSSWKVILPEREESIADTTKPNLTLLIDEGKITFTIHTFPADKEDRRIPPIHQVTRWKNQFQKTDPLSTKTSYESRGGFAGIFFETSGIFAKNNKESALLAWSMQLDKEHFFAFDSINKNLKADYTIKIMGPKNLIDQHREELIKSASTFECIEARAMSEE